MKETINSLWSEIRKGFVEEREAQFGQRSRPAKSEPTPEGLGDTEWSPSDDAHRCDGCARRDIEMAELERKVAEASSVIAELVTENEELTGKLKERPGAEAKPGKGEERYRKLKIAVAKHLHPDTAATSKPLATALERIFKELRAEIDRIDQM